MTDPLLTVLTPTYNRADYLGKLYDSLLRQNQKDFCWLVVDDGSTDQTENTVRGFQIDGKIQIDYLHKKNGGKHTALNVGIRQITTPLTMIVDSDDTLLPDAVSEIQRYYQKYRENERIAAWSFLRCTPDGKPISDIDNDEIVDNYIRYRIRQNRLGDMAEVFRTEVLKNHPFPEYPDEKFLSEDVVWIEIGKKYDSVFIHKAIYQCEYLEGGLTAEDKRMKFASPKGSMMRGKQLMSKPCGMKTNLKGAIIYNCYRRNTDRFSLPLSLREKTLCILAYPLSSYFYKKWTADDKSEIE